MTAETEATADEIPVNKTTQSSKKLSEIPTEISEIFDYLSRNERIVFKSQQIDDPPLLRSEKIEIAHEIYDRNKQTFLSRFGLYLEEKHLKSFADLAINVQWKADENGDEVQLMLVDFQRKLRTRHLDVKNRRYAALQQLIQKGEYFSELEMMKRAPELYQELVGQYLSDQEKKERDSYDVKNTTFSGILMHTMQQQEMEDVLKEVDEKNKRGVTPDNESTDDEAVGDGSVKTPTHTTFFNDLNDSSSEMSEHVSMDNYEVPASCRQQWGNFDNEHIACSTSQHTERTKPICAVVKIKSKAEATFITAGERELLRQEFVGIMHEQFLAGLDQDFNYTDVDDNSQLDDLQQLNQDKEDAYFEESDDDAEQDVTTATENKSDIAEESEDELDIYMSHLQKHHSLQQK